MCGTLFQTLLVIDIVRLLIVNITVGSDNVISRWERQKKATKTKAEILQTFIGCPTKLAYRTQNFV